MAPVDVLLDVGTLGLRGSCRPEGMKDEAALVFGCCPLPPAVEEATVVALFSLPAEDTVRPGYAWPRVSQGTPGGCCVAAVAAADEAAEEATLTLLRFLALPLEVVGFLD